MEQYLNVYGAKVHNLKDINVTIPRNQLVVITGLSGSGKSSLAFDTLYAEGQRRYMETFSAYARQFIGSMERPEVDQITGLSPVIAIEQKTTGKNPRSTVGTITEVYDFLRLLFARVGEAFSYHTGEKMVRYTEEQLTQLILDTYRERDILILAPLVKGRKGHYRELFEQIRRQGYLRVRVDGEIKEIQWGMQVDRYKVHDIEVVIDRFTLHKEGLRRMKEGIASAMKAGDGVLIIQDMASKESKYYSKLLMCPSTGLSYREPEPNSFSFNSPYGACPRCNGLGSIPEIDLQKVIPDDTLSIKQGGLTPLGTYKENWIFRQMEAIGEHFGFKLHTPIKAIPEEALEMILYGSNKTIQVKNEYLGVHTTYDLSFEGVINFIRSQAEVSNSKGIKRWAERFMHNTTCPQCHGQRLKRESLHVKIGGKNISEVASMDLSQLFQWLTHIDHSFSHRQQRVAHEILRELRTRVGFLLDVGLDYLTLNRQAKSLSGGESQRIRLATQIGSQLTGVLYILDEPSIGLHQRDNIRLIKALKELRDLGNSVIVVEHDREMIESADHVIDMGPGAGTHGGEIVAKGAPQALRQSDSITCQYLTRKRTIAIPEQRREGNGKHLRLKGARGNNLKAVSLSLPLGTFICVTGVSGSGKSSLINQTLYPELSRRLYASEKQPLPFDSLEGAEHIDKVIEIDQSPIGRTPRSNPATYTGVFTEIRKLFVELPEAKIRGYKPGRFSFNVKGGRCETCQGAGVKLIEMNFLPDVHVHCEACHGQRYNRETLEVRYKGKSINDVLNMTINQAVLFFQHIPSIIRKIKTLQEVGLGYLTLGQSATTLSGGEAQRVKLASELSKRDTGKTLYILDEPTTGLHFHDIKILLEVLQRLADRGNTILVIEHNMDVIKVADHLIDIGPEGGVGGGRIIAEGTPEALLNHEKSYTAQFLREELL